MNQNIKSEFIPELEAHIQNFLRMYEGTAIGEEVRRMKENGSSYESICDYIDFDYKEYEE